MNFEYKLAVRRRSLPAFGTDTGFEPIGPPARIARLVALSHQFESQVRLGQVDDYEELARLHCVSPARIGQIVILSQLAPAIQEYVLFLSAEHAGLITEIELREIAREVRWDRQIARFENLVSLHS